MHSNRLAMFGVYRGMAFPIRHVARYEHECTNCHAEIPPGKQGRQCQKCRKKALDKPAGA